ncbi:MAG: winged helix DNA-binding domain-containing protein [Chloroflexi bacterium]|nr:winged helix DNA-binding domain-containing protein [Chloroflexota bacterium]
MQNIATQRLQNQQIEYPRLKNPAEILSWMGAIQGQDYPGAKWSIGLRLPGSTDAQIEQAVADKQIARTWLMRGTLHLVASADISWMVELLAPRIIAISQPRYRELELDEQTFLQSNDVLVKALEGGQQRSRKDLFVVLEQHGISTKGQRGVHILHRASLDGLIFQGGMQSNNNPYFMRFDEALPDVKSMPRDAALAELARRYFTSRGPATLQDFLWWSGLLVGDARAGLEAVKSDLLEETIAGISYWRSANAMVAQSPGSPCVYIPPGFDEYLLGYKDRDAVLGPQHALKVCPGKNGIFFPTIVIDGRVVGVWKRTIKKDKVVIDPQPFTSLTEVEETAFIAAAQRFGEYLELPVAF